MDNTLRAYRKILGSVLYLLGLAGLLPINSFAVKQRSTLDAADPMAASLWSILERMPFTPEGNGPALYELGYTSCPPCIEFHKDWDGKLKGLQLRVILVPSPSESIPDISESECADAALSRDPKTIDAYFQRKKNAPSFKSSPARLKAYNQVAADYKTIEDILDKIDHTQGAPLFVWRIGNDVRLESGYLMSSMQVILNGLWPMGDRPMVGVGEQPDNDAMKLAGMWLGERTGFSLKLEISQSDGHITGRKLVKVSDDHFLITSFDGTAEKASASFHDVGILAKTSASDMLCGVKQFTLTPADARTLTAQWIAFSPCGAGQMILKREAAEYK